MSEFNSHDLTTSVPTSAAGQAACAPVVGPLPWRTSSEVIAVKTMACVLACGVVWVALAGTVAVADSPVTSTPFCKAYMDYRAVAAAQKSGVMSAQLAQYLGSPSVALDVKAAVVNALSWNIDGKHNAELYMQLRPGRARGACQPQPLRGDELLVVGYLTLMDDYQHPERALPLLEQARAKLPRSTTAAMIHALAVAQHSLLGSAAGEANVAQQVAGNDTLNGDMRVGAIRIIMEYMDLY